MGMQNTASHWRLKRHITSRRTFLITEKLDLLNFRLHNSTSLKKKWRIKQSFLSLRFFSSQLCFPRVTALVDLYHLGKENYEERLVYLVFAFFRCYTHRKPSCHTLSLILVLWISHYFRLLAVISALFLRGYHRNYIDFEMSWTPKCSGPRNHHKKSPTTCTGGGFT